MGGEQAAGVLATVRRDGIERAGGQWSPEDEAEFKRPTVEMFDASPIPSMPPQGCGTTGSSIRANRATSWPCHCAPA